MNAQEAYHVLGLPETSSVAEVQEKYNELYNDYQIRLTNAPTPNLKKLYQKNLEELNDALNALTADSTQSDLPASGPVFNIPAQTKRNTEQPQQAKTATATRTAPATKTEAKKNNNPVVISASLAIIGLAFAVFFGMKYFDSEKQLSDYAFIKSQNDSLVNLKKYFSNGKFIIQNDGQSPMTVTGVTIEYTNNKGEIERYSDQSYSTVIQPGTSSSLSRTKGDVVVWDGSVVAYCCLISYKSDIRLRAGLWSKDATKKDGVLHLNLDSAD